MKNWPHKFAKLLTVKQALKMNVVPATREELEERARDNSECEVCGRPVWRIVGIGMCFTCTTGEADASEDFELKLIE